MGSFANKLDLWTSTLVEFMLGNPLKEVGLVLLGSESKFTSGFRAEKTGWPKGPGPTLFIDLAAAAFFMIWRRLKQGPVWTAYDLCAAGRPLSLEAGYGLGRTVTHGRHYGTEKQAADWGRGSPTCELRVPRISLASPGQSVRAQDSRAPPGRGAPQW